MKQRLADYVADFLVEHGVTDCFSVVGGGAMHLNDALGHRKGLQVTYNHHEQACAMAAESYARYSGKMAAVCVTSGPGATNTLTGVMGAWVDGVPMIVISGNVRYETSIEKSGLPLRYRGLQEFDIIHSIQNMTKYSLVLTKPETVKYEVQKAVAIEKLGELSQNDFEACQSAIEDPVCIRRARHAVTENERTIQAVEALESNDLDTFGQLMNDSHRSLRDDYEVTGDELDALVEAAWETEGVLGSRMTGAGFGGCTISLVRTDDVDNFIKKVGRSYRQQIGYPADFYVCKIGGGPVKL